MIRSSKGLRQLTSELRDPTRTQPVIGLDADTSGGTPVIAAPVRSKTGRVVGAVSIEAPAVMIERLKMIEDFGLPLIKTTQWRAADLEDEPPFKARKRCDGQLQD